MEINILSHLLSMEDLFPDSCYVMTHTQRKTFRAQWFRSPASHHWGHQENTSPPTLDTKFSIPVTHGAAIFKRDRQKRVQTQGVWELKSLVCPLIPELGTLRVLSGRVGTGAVNVKILPAGTMHVTEKRLAVQTSSHALQDRISFELSLAAPHPLVTASENWGYPGFSALGKFKTAKNWCNPKI